MIKVEDFGRIEPHRIFSKGVLAVPFALGQGEESNYDKVLVYVAVKGGEDWAVYAREIHVIDIEVQELDAVLNSQVREITQAERENFERLFDDAFREGKKIRDEYIIRWLVPCSDEVFEKYRF